MKRLLTIILSLALILPAAALADQPGQLSPVGRWTIASSYNEMTEGYMFSKTDLFIFDDGNVFRVSIGKNKLENNITVNHDTGVWIGDQSGMTLRFGNKTFKAYIDADDFLYLEHEDTSVRFCRVCYKEEK